MFIRLFLILTPFICFSCTEKSTSSEKKTNVDSEIIVGAEQLNTLVPLLAGKKVGLMVNHTSRVKNKHLLDTLLTQNINVVKIFTPEHGFRGTADAGETIEDSLDPDTGIPIISLYGKKKKPSSEDVKDVEIFVCDLQDVGVRFYTYISVIHYIMQSGAEENIPVIILDRPNPNGHYIDGPIRESGFESFVGMHPIPVVHGCTLGELALMVNGEGWLGNDLKCDLDVIPIVNYTHHSKYNLPVKPSPNLPNMNSVLHYPSLCFFEGTTISIGRGTYHPFEVIGYPDSSFGTFTFTPTSIDGMSKYPKYENVACFGEDLRSIGAKNYLDLSFVLEYFKKFEEPDDYFNNYFDVLAGTDKLRKQIIEGMNESEIRNSWSKDLKEYKETRSKYTLYPD